MSKLRNRLILPVICATIAKKNTSLFFGTSVDNDISQTSDKTNRQTDRDSCRANYPKTAPEPRKANTPTATYQIHTHTHNDRRSHIEETDRHSGDRHHSA